MKEFENKRNLFRVTLPLEMCGRIAIHKFNEKVIDMGESHISILDISASGVKFKSKLSFPIENTIYKIIFSLYNIRYELECEVKWKSEKKNGSFLYGVEFYQTEDEKEELLQVMTKLSVQIKRLNEGIYTYCTKKCLKLTSKM